MEMKDANAVEQEETIKLILVGDTRVGKTSLLTAFVSNTFSEDFVPILNEVKEKKLIVEDTPVALYLQDTVALQEHEKLRPILYAQANGSKNLILTIL